MQIRRRLPLAAAALLVISTPVAAAAAEPGHLPPTKTVKVGGKTLHQLPKGTKVDKAEVDKILARAKGTSRVQVLLQLSKDPVAVAAAAAQAAGTPLTAAQERSVAAGVTAQQATTIKSLKALGGRVSTSVHTAYNGVSVSLTRSALAKAAKLPGVVGVQAVTTAKPMADSAPSPLLGVPSQVWDALGYDGSGVKIGIIDTGIDYTHADFGGPGTVAAYQSNDPTVIEPGTFPTAKVAGGYDFVGNDYDADTNPVPKPDPDPLDCDGHGSHVGGIAAGEGVTADGTYTGPYSQAGYDATDFVVSPGVAPKATLYGLKVFGCEGTVGDDIVISAIDWAVAHHLDIINLSLGSPYGVGNDAENEAIENAAAAGTVSVISAGNDGDSPYIVGAPSTSKAAISVAAVDNVPVLPNARLAVGGTTLDLQVSNQADVSSVNAPIVVLQDDPATAADESLGCDPASYTPYAGDIVVTVRGDCDRVARAQYGQQAGAAAVIMVNSSPGYPPIEGPIPGVTIPFLGATPEQGVQLQGLDGQTASLTQGAGLPNPNYLAPASFTSSGPGLVGDAAKPDLTAPGVSVVSAGVGTGKGPLTESGTSMSAPFVAGAAALVKQARPSLSVAQLKAALVNTADPSGVKGYSPVLAGAGLVDPDEAITTPVLAYDGKATSVSLGYKEGAKTLTGSDNVRILNTSGSAATYALTDEAELRASGATTVSISPSTVTVPAHGWVRVKVTVTTTPAGSPSANQLEAVAGNIVATPVSSGAPTLRVPYLMIPKVTSAVRADHSVSLKKGASSVAIGVKNSSPVAGSADVYSWASADDDSTDQPLLFDAPDVREVGVQSFPSSDLGVFAVSLHDRLANAAAADTEVLLDTDGDGSGDYVVVGVDNGLLTTGTPDGVFGSFTLDLASGALVGGYVLGGEINTSVVELPFSLSTVGLTAAHGRVDFFTTAFSLFGAGFDIVDEIGSFDAFHPALQTGQFATVPGGAKGAIPAAVDRARLASVPAKGWLVVSLEDKSGSEQADTVRLR
ncbi:PA domain-containing protein [Motilibacter peucedani]|uniref:PA domain-containing protein n=1 Tax=Motilibacter peucedani TaxID=598650 RepID=A0A420XNL8_9ACTN|nr:S8 family serine peptidase [Motilibacter peucedani]RKS73778.1 PA domain-containing protein [Motilibacter peucedani]